MNDVTKALLDGLSNLRRRGLAKDHLCDDQGRVCARGALLNAKNGQYWHLTSTHAQIEADKILCAVAAEQYPDRIRAGSDHLSVVLNNHPRTTQEDVERVFEKAIARSEEII